MKREGIPSAQYFKVSQVLNISELFKVLNYVIGNSKPFPWKMREFAKSSSESVLCPRVWQNGNPVALVATTLRNRLRGIPNVRRIPRHCSLLAQMRIPNRNCALAILFCKTGSASGKMHRATLLARYTLANRCIQSFQRSHSSNATRNFAVGSRRSQSRSASSAVMKESFLNGTSSIYVEQMYDSWRSDPSSVHTSWDAYFRNVEAGVAPGQAFQAPPTISSETAIGAAVGTSFVPQITGSSTQSIQDHLKIQLLIRSYQTRGHNIADLDPLGINSADLDDTIPPELELEFYGLSEKDLDREFILPPTTFIAGDAKSLTLREIINRLKNIYCTHTGIEYMHLTNYEQQEWSKRFESPHVTELTHDQKKTLFQRLIRSTKFEEFLAKKWPSEKRFGLEGCEVLIPAIKQVIDFSSASGVDSFVIGMPHRGRLNVLANVCRQPLSTILSQFSTLEPADEGSGDVKYHLGVCIERLNRQSQRNVKIAVVANPSHLEAVDPVVMGKVRAEAFYGNDTRCDRSLAIIMHGDAAFSVKESSWRPST
ncbi:hypothetical protein L596_015612 [Steinernema carpocapsae]|uniref:2-oxoglutarate dehydrogenase, mitochondrial n=1 Tax=Steinernema carpocapsae TaxID=34508 RepID=A0A4U5NG49_STECR|nr:hypothetical protein L596_015612 [Steinernema carpocapsae]